MDRPRRTPNSQPKTTDTIDPHEIKSLLKKAANDRYRAKLKSDPLKLANFKLKDAERKKQYRETLSEEQKAAAREKTRLRTIAYRERKKAETKTCAAPVNVSKTPKQQTRAEAKKLADRREKNRLSQQKRRANMHPQKRRREREKSLAYYYREKAGASQSPTQATESPMPQPNSTVRSGISRLKTKIATCKGNILVSLKGLVKSAQKKDPESLNALGVKYNSPSKPAPPPQLPASLSRKRDKKTVTAKRLFAGNPDLSPYKRKAKGHSQEVQRFFENSSSFIPGKQGVTKKGDTKKILSKSIVNVHKDFILEHGNLVSKATFFRHRPKNVLSFTKTPFRQCMCELCLNPMMKAKVLNKFTNGEKVESLKELINLTVCEGEKVDCLDRKCDECGVHQVDNLVRESSLDEKTQWQVWERVKKDNGSVRIELVHKEGKVNDMVIELKKDLRTLPKHDFVHRWQTRQFSALINDIPQDCAVLILDFAENYLCEQQDQPQSAYFGYTQVTVHPCVIYYGCTCGSRKTLNWTFLSDVLKHSADMVHAITKQILGHLSRLNIQKCIIFSDGCSSQYKSKLPFFHLQCYDDFGINIERCYFGARHGKNPCDALGGVLKQAASRAIKARQCIIQNAEDLLRFACGQLSVSENACSGHSTHMSRDYFLIKAADIQESTVQLKTFPGTRSLHSLLVTPDGLMTRNLSCFCLSCLEGTHAECLNKYYVQPWKMGPSKPEPVVEPTGSEPEESVVMDGGDTSPLSGDTSLSVAGSPMCSPEAFLESAWPEDHLICSSDQLNQAFVESDSSCDQDLESIENDLSLPSQLLSSLPVELPCRSSFFESLQHRLISCESFPDLRVVVKESLRVMHKFSMPEIVPRCLTGISGAVDAVAKNLVPVGLENLFPVLTGADGNCIPRSLSLIAFGDECHHIEIRCRIVTELVCNFLDYLSLDPDDLNTLIQLSDFQCPNTEQLFQQETLHVARNASYMGMWQLIAAANVLQCNIMSVYPALGPRLYRHFFNRTLKAKVKLYSHTPPIFWSATENHIETMPKEYWTANHVVPLMAMHFPIEVVEDE